MVEKSNLTEQEIVRGAFIDWVASLIIAGAWCFIIAVLI
jgi:hypothetical protein